MTYHLLLLTNISFLIYYPNSTSIFVSSRKSLFFSLSRKKIDLFPWQAETRAKSCDLFPWQPETRVKSFDLFPWQFETRAKSFELFPWQAETRAKSFDLFPWQAETSSQKIYEPFSYGICNFSGRAAGNFHNV